MTQVCSARVIAAMMGNHLRDPILNAKYALFLEALSKRLPLIDVYDSHLRGLTSIIHALMVIHPDRKQWRQRYYKYPKSFLARSRHTSDYISAVNGRADVSLQINTMFDATWPNMSVPNIIYTDYTAKLSTLRPSGGRSPFSIRLTNEWAHLERRAYERAAHICTRSHQVRESIINHYGVDPSQVTAIGGGLNFPVVPDPVNRKPTEFPTALFIGKDLYRKGGDMLLKAFARARADVPEARLILVTGEQPNSDLPLENVEVIVKPFLSREQLPHIYRRANVFVLPSRLETWGDVILEAMSFELPCIGNSGHAMQEIIVHEETGLIVSEGDIEDLSSSLIRLLASHEERTRWGRNSRERIKSGFTWDHVIDRLTPIVNRICNTPVVH